MLRNAGRNAGTHRRGDAHIAPTVLLNEIGSVTKKCIDNIDTKHDDAHVDQYVIISNRIHMIIALINGAMWASPPTEGMAGASRLAEGKGAMWASRPTDARIPKIIGTLKTLAAKESGVSVFQKPYYDHIIGHEANTVL